MPISYRKFLSHLYVCIGVITLLGAGQYSPVFADQTPDRTMESNTDPVRSHFGGPNSVGGTNMPDTAPSSLDSYFNFKTAVEKELGLAFGFDYNALFQEASDSPGKKSAAGGIFRLFRRWTLTGKDSGDAGILVYKVENRHGLGTEIPPQGLGSELGYLGLTALPFSQAGWVLTNLFWEQHLMENRLAFVLGFVDVTDYVDTYSLVSPWTEFSNLAFSTNPAIPAPNQVLGAAVRLITADHFYLNGGLADANGDPSRPDQSLESFFTDAEYFTHVEIGWISKFKERF